ncbi:hypothetical protein RhiirA4_475536 [Rhizophagus irregularis]|uniref:Uncharacterized protein n=1 Tax=Rhizophagus irregularis TaxID=588596 RepID=A0A2I1HA99_9GLOM|nr:hypothetical protein RhiirA4_475536 [Rhizophagus irregularis]
MTPVDQTVIPENSRKKDKQKAHVTDDKQVKNQLTTANPGYEAVACQRHNSLRYSIYLGPAEDNSRVKTLGSTIKCSVKRQHKYQTLRVKIALSSFALSQFNKFWTTDLGGIPCGASAFKIIQTSKGRRKLMAYFENWETTLRALDTPPVTSPTGGNFAGLPDAIIHQHKHDSSDDQELWIVSQNISKAFDSMDRN